MMATTATIAAARRSGAGRGEVPTPSEFVRELKRLLKQSSVSEVAAYYDQFAPAVAPALTERQRTSVGNIMHIVDAATERCEVATYRATMRT